MKTFRAVMLALAALWSCNSPAATLDLFASHTVTVQFATADGRGMPDADVKVYAPGDPTHVVKTGKTDKDGKFEFSADRDGLWTAEARVAGEVARATVRVGDSAAGREAEGVSPYLVIGALGVLLLMAVGVRFLRARTRRRSGRSPPQRRSRS